jgi:4-amino-4-deoxy-L-arabinose transferase-like glycosyltransferase
VTIALGVVLADVMMGRADTDAYLSGPRVKYLKAHHVLWKVAETICAYLLVLVLTSSRAAALLGAILIGTHQPDIDTLQTELEAATLLMLGITLLIVGLSRRKWYLLLLAGISLGLLALTKAIFLYVFVVLLPAVPLVMCTLRERTGRRQGLAAVALLVLGFAVTTLPWMIRNQIQLGSFHISERGGMALYLRALLNGMTRDEYAGTFYVWSPRDWRKLAGRVSGFGPEDLERGGRLQRLNRDQRSSFAMAELAAERSGNPDAAITFYSKARAERVRLADSYTRAGNPGAYRAADEEMQARALTMMVAHPFRHLALTVPLLWRGAALQVPVLALALVYSVRSRQRALLLTILFAVAYLMMYAFFTHFESRYGAPTAPITGVVAVVPLVAAWRHVRRALAGQRVGPAGVQQ